MKPPRLTRKDCHLAAVACRLRVEACEENNNATDARMWRRIELKLSALAQQGRKRNDG
jgi:hypothetical protein